MLQALYEWENLIDKTLNPLNPELISFTDECIQKIVRQSEDRKEEFRRSVCTEIINIHCTEKKQYIHIRQAMIIRLINKIHSYEQSDRLSANILHLYNGIGEDLKSSLGFIEDFFSDLLNRNERIPITYITCSDEGLSIQLKLLKQSFEESKVIDQELAHILLNSFNKLFAQNYSSLTYNEFFYLKDLINELLCDKLLASPTHVYEILFYLNYNNDDYVTYFLNKLSALTESLPTRAEKIDRLRFEQKNLNQLRRKPDCSFCSTMPSLTDQINHWIEEEIKYLEINHVAEKIQTPVAEPEEKIHTSLSVAKLALLLKLMVNDKIITNRIVAHVLRIAVRLFTTLQKENIAFGSLETKYHNPDRGTICSVKDMLFRWINILNKL